MIDKFAGLPTQIRQLEKRLKDMDASKVKPALVKEITDTIKNLKDMLKEKQEKREQRKKEKEDKAQEVQKEAITVPSATEIGAVAPNAVNPVQEGQPEATPTTPNNQNASCPLCGGLKFADQAQYQQHMQFTHGSNVMPTNPVQKLDKTVASVDVEAGNKCALCNIEFASWPEYDAHRKEKHGPTSVKSEAETGPQFKLDDEVKPIRGSESKGKVMRWDGKPNDLVYVMWESGPLKDRDGFGGYYPHDLKKEEVKPVEAALPEPEPVCEKCVAMQEKHGDLKTNYEALLKDLQEEREAHYAQGNHSWVMRLDQKIEDLKKAIAEKFPTEVKPEGFNEAVKKQAIGGPRLIRQIHRATSGHGYEATEYDLANGQFKQNIPLKINETGVRMTDPTKSQYEVKYDGMDWRLVAPQEFEQWLAQWKEVNQANVQKEGAVEHPVDPKWGPDHDTSPWTCSCGAQIKTKNEGLAHFRAHHGKGKTAGAQNAEELTIMDHTPPRANSGPDTGGKDPADEFQDEWAMPITSEVKLNVFKRELLATPSNQGYDISHEGKKLFNITGKDKKPMSKKQLEFCAQIEFTRGMKQAKLVEKIASLEAGSTVFVMAQDKTTKRVKFASLEHGFRGWAPASKFAFLVKEGQMMQHKDHIDNTFGHNGKQALVDCPNGSGNMVWVAMGELLPINPPPATPESLNDLESALGCKYCDHRVSSHTDGKGNSAGCSICDCTGYKSSDKQATQKCKECGTGHMPLTRGICAPCRKDKKASIDFPLAYFTRPEAKQRADQFGLIDVEDSDLTPAGLAAKKQEMLEGHDVTADKSVASDAKNPITWNGKDYFGVLVDMDGNIISGYTYEQGEDAGWDLYFTSEEDVAWSQRELVYVFGDDLTFQWGTVYGGGKEGPLGMSDEECKAKEVELLPKIKSQITVNANNVKAAKECPLCGREFNDPKSYTDHEQRHKVTGAKECPDCKGHYEGTEGEKCPTCGRFAVMPKEGLKQALPPQIVNRRTEVNASKKCEKCHKEFEPQHGDNRFCSKECYRNSGESIRAFKKAAIDQTLLNEFKSKHPTYNGWLFDYEYPGYYVFYSNDGSVSVYFTPDFNEDGVVDVQIMNNEGDYLGGDEIAYQAPLTVDQLFNIVKPFLDKQETLKTSSLNKVARVVEHKDGWHVLSEKGKNLGGPYKTKAEAVKRLRQVEYFKHHGSLRAFSKNDKVIKRAETLIDPYQALTTHITDMRSRMTQVQDKIQSVPAVKTAGEDNSKLDLPGLFADLTQGIELLETKLGGDDDIKPELHKQIEELENKLWKLEEACGITPKLSEEEKAEPEHKEIVEDIEKKADTPVDPNAPATPVPQVQNVQPTDNDNLTVPVVAPTSPPPPGQKWVFDTQFNEYVLMPDPAASGRI